jgi:hypothetical protein
MMIHEELRSPGQYSDYAAMVEEGTTLVDLGYI